MTATNHSLTGAVVALTVKNPTLAVPLAFISHFILDVIPHHDYFTGENNETIFSRKFNILLTVDFIVALLMFGLIASLFPDRKWFIWLCMALAACPDLAQSYYHLYQGKLKGRQMKLDPISKFHYGIQNESTYLGAAVEIVWFILAGAIILSLR